MSGQAIGARWHAMESVDKSVPCFCFSPHQEAPGSLGHLAGGILIEVALQGGEAAMSGDLGHLAPTTRQAWWSALRGIHASRQNE